MIDYIKAKNWDGKDLKGHWTVSLKIDGVRALLTEDGWLSRNGKPLKGMIDVAGYEIGTNIEIFKDSWEQSITVAKTTSPTGEWSKEFFYKISPGLDQRLLRWSGEDLTAEQIDFFLEEALEAGYEGLVLRQEDTWLKVKPIETYDVKVIGVKEGRGRNCHKLGAFLTDMGNVGTGFTDEQRQDFWRRYQTLNEDITIEVECMELTPNGKFRHPRFIRIRWDK